MCFLLFWFLRLGVAASRAWGSQGLTGLRHTTGHTRAGNNWMRELKKFLAERRADHSDKQSESHF
jgi:hypothetical protein